MRVRYAACIVCRSEAQKVAGITDRQHAGLSLGREKGTNHRAGYSHREESKQLTAAKNKEFWAAHPDKAIERGSKIRGDKSPHWKGGIAKLNKSIRTMTENRKWMDAVKRRDGCCLRCGSKDHLESHHLKSFAELLAELSIKTHDDAREHAEILWDLGNGETLCQPCHFQEHGRTFNANR